MLDDSGVREVFVTLQVQYKRFVSEDKLQQPLVVSVRPRCYSHGHSIRLAHGCQAFSKADVTGDPICNENEGQLCIWADTSIPTTRIHEIVGRELNGTSQSGGSVAVHGTGDKVGEGPALSGEIQEDVWILFPTKLHHGKTCPLVVSLPC